MATLAVEKSPDYSTLVLNLADAEAILGLTEQAAIHYQQVIALHQDQQDVKSWLERAQALVHIGKAQEAVKALNQAKKLAPHSGEVAFAAALVYAQLNEDISALSQVEEALSDNVGVIWFNLPWFDRLCDNPQFIALMTSHNNAQRCQSLPTDGTKGD